MNELVEALLYGAAMEHWYVVGGFIRVPEYEACRKVIIDYESKNGRKSREVLFTDGLFLRG